MSKYLTMELFRAIENSSDELLEGVDNLEKRIKSAKNYVANQNLDKWAFSKLIATENFDIRYGSQAKLFFYDYGFINILKIKNYTYRENTIQKFLKWSRKIKYFDIGEKFKCDQEKSKRFELLVHIDQIPKHILDKEDLLKNNDERFVEGFKIEIIKEITYRNQKLIKKAKQELGVTCSICQFNFEKTYGLHGKGFIEMHHLFSISKGERSSSVNNLIPVCANCHRMMHKGKIIFTKDDIKAMIEESKSGDQ